jgi:autoinducer 2-degrading protein
MIVTIVYVEVIPAYIESFISVTTLNHLHSVREPGNLRFDVLQMEEHANRFALYEAYESEEAAMAHKETPHYQEWREKVAPWMARTREGIRYHSVIP